MKKLSDRTKKIIGNVSLAVPFGYLGYASIYNDHLSKKENKDSGKVYSSKIIGNLIYTTILSVWVLWGVMTNDWTPKQIINGHKQRIEKEKENSRQKLIKEIKKKSLIEEIDKDKNGLSYDEQFQIYKLMGISDSSKIYQPTLDDWERAYDKYISNQIE
ncbi:MAG: hypothetical protein WC812_02730 [Candidatus Pacearchaeota archaeon]|jgi:hypothetical protein